MWGLSRPGIESVFPALEVDSQPLDHQGFCALAAFCALKVILYLVARLCLTLSGLYPWTVAHQAPLSMEILQARRLVWVAISFFRESELTP